MQSSCLHTNTCGKILPNNTFIDSLTVSRSSSVKSECSCRSWPSKLNWMEIALVFLIISQILCLKWIFCLLVLSFYHSLTVTVWVCELVIDRYGFSLVAKSYSLSNWTTHSLLLHEFLFVCSIYLFSRKYGQIKMVHQVKMCTFCAQMCKMFSSNYSSTNPLNLTVFRTKQELKIY